MSGTDTASKMPLDETFVWIARDARLWVYALLFR